ncbi:hypothetical protein C8Q77DRAFT_829186 [Trametes polyzona]|nr:hypothetical protein C8Q77DRAFT_829186 [Trametes polyzona]
MAPAIVVRALQTRNMGHLRPATWGDQLDFKQGSCSTVAWATVVTTFLASLGPGVFTIWRAYALSGKSKLIGGAMLIMGLGTMIYNAVVELYTTPINLPPPENCSIERNLMNILGAACPVVGLTLVTVVTWRKTRGTELRSELGSEFSRRRPSLPQILFKYGMFHFCVILVLDLAGTVLDWSSLSLSTNTDGRTFVGFFIAPLTSILTSRLLLDMYETEAQLQRGGVSNTGSFSINLGSNGRPGPISTPEFITSYGGPARSFPDEDDTDSDADADADAEATNTSEYFECVPGTAGDTANTEVATPSGSGYGQVRSPWRSGGTTDVEALGHVHASKVTHA